ncbi:tetraacyldisaccharide 4'-kinase [Thermodesulfovibrio aggregans]|uniref:Tetraacyldisaccharide 4'-kinase n=1 Tax=Thermodesulfovibrio aggregans TaxID=86166 RepID=A0A0U9HQF4_9BACT|nr:tetraacyldisaccharide 4'-kinase [Thermodesulfovibrio aggregans]GAQ95262.1 tetraacyldisaccharide 4'-kinase [Thermodesulfovibrio aggregans]
MNIFERIYLFFYLRKKNNALKQQRKLPFPVISVGNLTVGGTGKTPFTVALSKELKKRGYLPVILTRGYRGRLKGPFIVSQEMNAEDAGDEPLMMAMEGLIVVKSADRFAGGVYAIEKLGFDEHDRVIFILDDGFQHWKLYRDLNILLVDGYRGFGNCRLVPFGPLRSPLSEISEADMVFITKKENEKLKEKLNTFGIKKIYFAPLTVEGIKDRHDRQVNPYGKKVFAFAGIGNFQSFIDCLKSLNLNIIGQKKFIDHKKYDERVIKKIEKLARNADLLITTKKDFVKLKEKAFKPELCYLEISLRINEKLIDTLVSIC